MPVYSDIIGRSDLTNQMIPDQLVNEIIQDAPTKSFALSHMRQVRMSSKKQKQSVLTTLPEAYWVEGDNGLKQTSKAGWEDTTMTAEELAVIVPIPDSVVDDANVPLWSIVRPLIAEAIGLKIDNAVLFGVDKPTSWGDDVITGATTANQFVQRTASTNFAQDVAALGQKMAKAGVPITGFAAEPGLNWELIGLTDTTGQPIYHPSMATNAPATLYGYDLNEVKNGVWDDSKAKLIAADWKKFIIGIRQDITYSVFSEGVITDATGKVILNLMQQDTKALRVVMRLGYTVAKPVKRLTGQAAFPAGFIKPAAA